MIAAWGLLAGSAALLVGVLSAVAWPPHDCGKLGCGQRSNRWHSHPEGDR